MPTAQREVGDGRSAYHGALQPDPQDGLQLRLGLGSRSWSPAGIWRPVVARAVVASARLAAVRPLVTVEDGRGRVDVRDRRGPGSSAPLPVPVAASAVGGLRRRCCRGGSRPRHASPSRCRTSSSGGRAGTAEQPLYDLDVTSRLAGGRNRQLAAPDRLPHRRARHHARRRRHAVRARGQRRPMLGRAAPTGSPTTASRHRVGRDRYRRGSSRPWTPT